MLNNIVKFESIFLKKIILFFFFIYSTFLLGQDTTTTYYLIRHAEKELSNPENKLDEQTDVNMKDFKNTNINSD